VALIGEQGLETLGLGIGEQAGPSQQGAPGPVERVTRPAPPAHDRSLDAAAALIELAGSQRHDIEGVHDCPSLGELLAGGAVEPGETIHGHHLDLLTPGLVALGEPGLEDLLDTGPGPRPADEPDHCGGVRGS